MNDEEFERYIEIYKELKKYQSFIGNIDKDFFFAFSSCMIEKILELEKRLNDFIEQYMHYDNQ